jgi:hypothetical protein
MSTATMLGKITALSRHATCTVQGTSRRSEMSTLGRLQTHDFTLQMDDNARGALPAVTRREAPCFDTSQVQLPSSDADETGLDARRTLQGACESNVAC